MEALTASFYYLLHSTWVTAGLFLLAGVLIKQRQGADDRFVSGPSLHTPARLGILFFLGAIAVAGLPPFSGFIGKLGLLQAATGYRAVFFWTVLLLTGFVVIVSLSRSGKVVFWETQSESSATAKFSQLEFVCALMLLSSALWLSVFAEPVLDYCRMTAQQLLNPEMYMQQLGGE